MSYKSDLKKKIVRLQYKIDAYLHDLYILQNEYAKLEKNGYGTPVYYRQRVKRI